MNYSIIIPHKNIPNLLTRCIASIPRRKDIEVIVVDDSSSPNIVDFNNFPGTERENVTTIFDKSGAGAGRARNIGIRNASGKWIIFADADDYFLPDAFSLFDKYLNSPFGIIYFGAETVDENGNKIDESRRKSEDEAIDAMDKSNIRYQAHVPWAKMFLSKLIKGRKIHFSETIAANDTMFVLRAGYYAKRVEIEPHKVYAYIIRNNSLTQTSTPEIRIARLKIFCERNHFIIKKHIPIPTTFLMSIVNSFRTDGKKSSLFWKAFIIYITHQPPKALYTDFRRYYVPRKH